MSTERENGQQLKKSIYLTLQTRQKAEFAASAEGKIQALAKNIEDKEPARVLFEKW